MNKMIKLVVIALGCAAMFAGCGAKTPGDVSVAFMQKLSKGDFEGAKAYCDKTTAGLLTMMEGMAANDPKALAEFKEKEGAKFEVTEEKIDGDKASVRIKITNKDGEIEEGDPVDLVKVDGEWKVAIKK